MVTSPYCPVIVPATNVRLGLSTSDAVNCPDAVGALSSVTLAVAVEITGASSVPVILTVTVVVLPSLSVTVYTSDCCSPPASA